MRHRMQKKHRLYYSTVAWGLVPVAHGKVLPVTDHVALIETRDLVKYFPVRQGFFQRTVKQVRAVDHVNLTIHAGETLGLVGESGCGKSTLGRVILRLIEPTSGEIRFEGQDLTQLDSHALRMQRRKMQIVFQDPYGALDPRMTIGQSIGQGLRAHGVTSAEEREERVRDVLLRVGLSDWQRNRFPHEFSGGQRQRIGIARALVLKPQFIVCDEPVSALDVSIQSQVLNLLRDLQNELGLTYLFIAHNLSVVEYISDRVAVMYLGQIVELASRQAICQNALHPYTRALISAIPMPDPTLKRERILLKGDVPSPMNPPSGCRFHTRCYQAFEICSQQEPALCEVEPEHWVACHLCNK